MKHALLCIITATAIAAASAAQAAPGDRYGLSPAGPQRAEVKPLWKRIVALEWIERAPRLAPALQPSYAAPAQAQGAPMTGALLRWSNKSEVAAGQSAALAAAGVPERIPGGLYAKALSQIEAAPAAPVTAVSAQPSLAGVAPAVDPRPRQSPLLP